MVDFVLARELEVISQRVGCHWHLLSALSGRGFVSRLDIMEPGIGLQGLCISFCPGREG